jgi:serine protease Do
MTPDARAPRRRTRRPGRSARAWLVAALLLGAPAWAGEQWGWLGVRIRDLTEQEMEDLSVKTDLREGAGVLVAEVIRDTPAQQAGLRDGDLIVAIDGRPVVETRTLQRLVGATSAGRELALVVLREGRRESLSVRVGRMPDDMVAERVALEFGFFVRNAAPEGGAGAASDPAVVAAIAEGSPAARGGLMVGDRVLAVNDRETASMESFRALAKDLLLRDPLRLRVERRGESVSLTLPPAQMPAR